MARVKASPGNRVQRRRPTPLLATALALGLLAALAAGPAWAGAAGPDADPTVTTGDPVNDPGGEGPPTTPAEEPAPTEVPGGEPGPTEPAPETTAPPPQTTPPAPVTTAPEIPPVPTTLAPAPDATTRPPGPVPPTAPPGPPTNPTPPFRPPASGSATPPQSPLGVQVSTGDVTLTEAYWNAASTAVTLQVTVHNTGTTTQRIRLSYMLPAGLTDDGTKGCAAADAGGAYRCGAWTAEAGVRFSTMLDLRVAGTAWKQMPLGGSVQVTADTPGAPGEVTDEQGFAVLFPPGPPAPGIALAADEVAFDISGGPATLTLRLGNTGTVDASGQVEVVLPAGVTVPTPPLGCVTVEPTRTRCDTGLVLAGTNTEVQLPVEATPQAQREAPLSGALIGQLQPRSGPTRRVQMSFRITAAAALAPPVVSPPAPTGSQGVLLPAGAATEADGLTSVQRTAIILIAVSTLLVVLALTLATTSLRRRFGGTPRGPAPNPAD
ncbi:hypothetical protein EV382_5764 [Micromonospora violae]|uniref:Repeat protein (TIGR01451 family) n=1 Tax=Micromonospora violae TaxID=1278207 RepID=A0A4Q7UM23_9ACTN|nr:hypothetical protein [Micromonospora violae]RZT82456.1 hypothetical protein EV382_5764 [Micromonospora violae]